VFSLTSIVLAHPPRLPHQQSWPTTNLHTYSKGYSHRSISYSSHSPDLQAFCWSHGTTATPPFDPLRELAGETSQSHQEPHHRPPTPQLPQSHTEFRRRSRSMLGLHLQPEQKRKHLRLRGRHGPRKGRLCRRLQGRQHLHQQLQSISKRGLQ
jgi:hypothetical protein